MRISSSPLSGNGSAVSGAEPQAAPASQDPQETPAMGNGVQFGAASKPLTFMDQVNQQMDDAQAAMEKLEKEIESSASSLKDQFDQLMNRLFSPAAEATAPSAAPTDAPASASATVPVAPAVTPSSPTDPATTPVAAASADGAFLDNSKYSSPEALKKWAPMVANLPADQQLQAEKELNRPIAAAQMAQEGGANGAQAMAFINANPALKNAIDTAINPKADGIINNKDLSRFVSQSQSAADAGDKDLADYRKSNPNADAQSLQMVTSAALMRANSYLTVAADPAHSAGASQQTNVNGLTDQAGLAALQNSNPGLSGALRQAAKTWSQPGFFNQLDQGGLSGRALAAHSPDGLFNAANIDGWIKKQAPTNGGEFASMLSDAATINAVSSTDISTLGKDVFDHPQNYTGAQKAAVMVKLQQTKQSVDAGSDLRKTGDTEGALAEKVGQLQSDPDVQAYLQQAVPSQERALVASDPALKTAVYDQMQKVNNGQALRNDMNTAQKNQGKGAAAPDYSGALNGLSAQLQLQRDLLGPNVKVPTAQQVVGNQPAVQKTLQDAYQANFTHGGELHQLLGQKKADASQALQSVEVHKSAYEDVLPDDFVQRQHASVERSTANELVQSKAGRSFLDKVANGDSGATAVLAMTATQKAQQIKDSYDDAKDGISGLKDGVDVVRKMAGREASAGLGRLAAGAAIRIGAAVGAEAAGAAVASTIGVAAGPVGWAIDAALSLGLGIAAIIAAVQKHAAAKHFDHNVDPTLDQFGIPRPH